MSDLMAFGYNKKVACPEAWRFGQANKIGSGSVVEGREHMEAAKVKKW